MGVKHLTYLDLSEEQRREAANDARARLQMHLSNPTLTGDDHARIMAQIAELDRWEAGTIPVGDRTPTAHVVHLTESVEVKAKIG